MWDVTGKTQFQLHTNKIQSLNELDNSEFTVLC